MKKLYNYKYQILTIILVAIASSCVVFGHNIAIQGGVACLFFGLAIGVMCLITKQSQEKALKDYDVYSREILTDINEKGENSEHYPYFNITILQSIKTGIEKRYRKQIISFITIITILLITAIICFYK